MTPKTSGHLALARANEYSAPLAGRGERIRVDQAKLAAWMLAKSAPAAGEYRCTFFVLYHNAPGGPEPVSNFPFPAKADDIARDILIRGYVAEIGDMTSAVADQQGSRQSFTIGGQVTNDREEHSVVQYPLTVTADPSMMSGYDATALEQGGTAAAVTGHAQRLLDTFFRGVMAEHRADKDRLVQEANDARAFAVAQQERASVEAQLRLDLMRAHQASLDAQALRDVEVYRQKQRADLEHQLLTAMGGFAIKIGGGLAEKYLPQGTEHPLLAWAKTLGREQLAPLLASLSPEQAQSFAPYAQGLLAGMSEEDKRVLVAEVCRLKAERDASK